MANYGKIVKKFVVYLIYINFTFINASDTFKGDFLTHLADSSLTTNLLWGKSDRTQFFAGISEQLITQIGAHIAGTKILSFYDNLISKLSTQTQQNYKNLTTKIDNSLNNIIEKISLKDKKLSDRTTLDKIKIMSKGFIGSYLERVLLYFSVFALRSAIHSNLNGDSIPVIGFLALDAFNIKIHGIKPYKHITTRDMAISALVIKEYLNAWYAESDSYKREEIIKIFKSDIETLEISDPKRAKETKKVLEEFENAIAQVNSPLRNIGTFVLKVLIYTAITEGKYAFYNYINNPSRKI